VNSDGQNDDNINHSGVSLSEFFRHHRQRREPLVLATVARTIGSTYRKAGAQMLIARDGTAAGLLSGGCLEADLMERARTVLDTGRAMTVDYDTRSSDDVIWGIGLGCEGAMTILLTRLSEENGYEPFAFAERSREQRTLGRFSLVIASNNAHYPVGQASRSDAPANLPRDVTATLTAMEPRAGASAVEADDACFLIVPVELPPHLLLLGAGPDAMPLVEFAAALGWRISVFDHRPAYAIAERFPRAARVQNQPAAAISHTVATEHFDAAVVMSHHLPSDQAYLAALADSDIGYVGLLGPAPRRVRLLTEIGPSAAQRLGSRLYGPIGLDIGARTPEAIALAIVSEIQAVLSGHSGGSFSHKKD